MGILRRSAGTSLSEFCKTYYCANLLPFSWDDGNKLAVQADRVSKALKQADEAIELGEPLLFLAEIMALRYEVFALAWVHTKGESRAAEQSEVTRRFLNADGWSGTWDDMEDYNLSIGEFAAKGSPVIVSPYASQNIDEIALKRALNRLSTEAAWTAGVIPELMAETFFRRLEISVNKWALAEMKGVILFCYRADVECLTSSHINSKTTDWSEFEPKVSESACDWDRDEQEVVPLVDENDTPEWHGRCSPQDDARIHWKVKTQVSNALLCSLTRTWTAPSSQPESLGLYWRSLDHSHEWALIPAIWRQDANGDEIPVTQVPGGFVVMWDNINWDTPTDFTLLKPGLTTYTYNVKQAFEEGQAVSYANMLKKVGGSVVGDSSVIVIKHVPTRTHKLEKVKDDVRTGVHWLIYALIWGSVAWMFLSAIWKRFSKEG